MEGVRKLAKVCIGSAALALASTFVTAALALYGIIDMAAARLLLFLAWLAVVIGTSVSDYLCDKPRKSILKVTVLMALIAGGMVFGIDRYAVNQKAKQDAAMRPAPILVSALKPTVPIKKTDWRWYRKAPVIHQTAGASSNVIAGNNNVTATGGATIQQASDNKAITQSCPNGICIGGDNSGNAIVNNYGVIPPNPLILTDEQGKSLAASLSRFSGQNIKLQMVGGMVDDPFGKRLEDALRGAGLNVTFATAYEFGMVGLGHPPTGISFAYGKNRVDILDQLAKELAYLQIAEKPFKAWRLDLPDSTDTLIMFVASQW